MSFAVLGVNHPHIHSQIACLKRGGAELAAFYAQEDDLAAAFSEKYPEARRVSEQQGILDDESIQIVTIAAIPADRAEISIAAMRSGKDVLSDKPGAVSLAELARIDAVQRETGRIFAILYSEHFDVPSVVRAGELVAKGAIGDVVNVIGMGPHMARHNQRPDWFYDRARYGGILADIGSHQFEQFLFFANTLDVDVLSASVSNRTRPDRPGLQDIGDVHLRSPRTTGYLRVDWFTPDGLGTWGDGRLTILGTEGYIEIRKYIDIAGRAGSDHLLMVDKKGVQHIDCAGMDLPFGRQFIADVRDRTETAMPRARCFKAMELALKAQAIAEHGTEWAR